MDNAALSAFIAERIKAGLGKAQVKEELLSIGWTEEEIEAAYRAGVIALGAPVPSEGNRPTTAKPSSTVDIVINFFSFILLGITATALGTLLFQVINQYFPDALDATALYSSEFRTSTIHYAIAALLIGFPLYFLAMRLWFRKFREDEGRSESKLSKWLTYLVLLAAAVTIVGDLIAIVFTLLQGEVTVRFFLKALTILIIAGGIFGFYYLERRKIQYRVDIPRSTFQYFGRGAAGLVALSVVLGFLAGGSPQTARELSLDRTRADHLNSLSNCVRSYAESLGALPTNLDQLRQSSQFGYCSLSTSDPETGEPYTYRVITPSRVEGAGRVGEFELCATFAQATSDENRGLYGEMGVWYQHSAGRSCDIVTAQLLLPTPPIQAPLTLTPIQ